MENKIKENALIVWLKYIILLISTLIVILPILVVFLGSFKSGEEFNRSKPFDLPKFVANNEIWKGTGDLSSGDVTVSKELLAGHDLKAIVLVHNEVEDTDNQIQIKDLNNNVVASARINFKTEESTLSLTETVSAKLKEGFIVSGKNVTVRRIKSTDKFFFGNYKTAFTKGNMLLGFWNTFILILFSGIGTILTGSMTAYVLSRFRFKAKTIVQKMFLWISLIPTITTQVATFQIIQKLHMYNTHLSVIVLSMGTDIIAIMIYLQFLNNISKSLDESAIMDGAGYFQVFAKIIFPLLQPATVTILILKCVNLYNDFYNPLLYMPKTTLQVISTSLYKFKGPFGTNWPVICAGVVVAVIPTLIAFLTCQKYIYSGMVTGSVKE